MSKTCLFHIYSQIDRSECRFEVRGAGVHIGGVLSGPNIHQWGIFEFCNEPHVLGGSMYTLHK